MNFDRNSQTFFATLLMQDVHIDVIHNNELYDQLVGIFHDRQSRHMHQMLPDFFHPRISSKSHLLLHRRFLLNNAELRHSLVNQVEMH